MTDHPTAGDKPIDKPADNPNSTTNGPSAIRPTVPRSIRRITPPAAHADVKSADQTPDMPITAPKGEYGVDQMKYLTDLEHVRERSGMYIGDTGMPRLAPPGLRSRRQSIDEAMAGHAHDIYVTINVDGSVTVADDGRGIPVEMHPELGISTLEGVMTVLKFGGKFDKQAYKTSGGLHGIGVKVVNFLSEWCEVEVRRDGHIYQQEYERGVPTGRRPPRRHAPTGTGTKTTFKPDPQDLRQHEVRLQHRCTAACRSWRFSTAACKIVVQRRSHRRRRNVPLRARPACSSSSISTAPANRPIPTSSTSPSELEGVGIEVAMQYTDGIHRKRPHLRQQHQHRRRRHAPLRLSHRPDAHAEQLRQEGQSVQRPDPHRRGFPRRADGRHLAFACPSRSSNRKPRSS